jgi:ADP-ribose pyrophosphatase YjhB (NUDIX family)
MVPNKFTTAGLVFNEAGQILMIKHKKKGKWLPPGGHVDENELPCEAVAREIMDGSGFIFCTLAWFFK